MDLVLPWPHHRVPALEFLTFAYGTANRATVEVSALGVVGTVGLAGLAVSGLLALLVGRRQRPDHARWSGLMLVSFLLYTVGGLGSFIALFGTPQVRTWSRMSIYLLALALLAVGAWLTRVERRRGVLVAGGVAAALTVVGSLDQTNPAAAPDHGAIASEMAGLRTYTTRPARTGSGRAARSSRLRSCPTPRPAGLSTAATTTSSSPTSQARTCAGPPARCAARRRPTGCSASTPDDLRALAGDLRSVGFCALEVDTEAFTAAQDPTARLTDALGEPVAENPRRHVRRVGPARGRGGGRGRPGPPRPGPSNLWSSRSAGTSRRSSTAPSGATSGPTAACRWPTSGRRPRSPSR